MASQKELQKSGVLELQEARLCVLDENGMKSFLDIHEQIVFFILSQDLFESSININISMVDAVGHLSRFNKSGYQGQEFVELKCKKPGDDGELIDLQFWIYEISEIGGNFKNDGSSYNLLGKTKEKIIDTYSDVNQAFTGTYSSVANTIFDNYITKDSRNKKLFKKYPGFNFKKRSFDVHESVVENQFIVPGLQPFAAIDMCARRCLGRKGSNAAASNIFTFYETIGGYKFHCLDDLINDGKKNHPDPDLTFEYEPMRERNEGGGGLQASGIRFDRKIREIVSLKTSDNLMNGNGGVLKNTVLIVDTVSKSYSRRLYDYESQFNNVPHLGNTPLVDSNYLNNFVRPSYEHLYFKDSTKNNQQFDQILGVGLPFVVQLYNLQLTFVIEGDTSIKPGQVLKINLPELSAITSQPTDRFSTKFSGFWLVKNVLHEYSRDAFHTTISCLKDSISEAMGEEI